MGSPSALRSSNNLQEDLQKSAIYQGSQGTHLGSFLNIPRRRSLLENVSNQVEKGNRNKLMTLTSVIPEQVDKHKNLNSESPYMKI